MLEQGSSFVVNIVETFQLAIVCDNIPDLNDQKLTVVNASTAVSFIYDC